MKKLEISSFHHNYSVSFKSFEDYIKSLDGKTSHLVIDERIHSLYRNSFNLDFFRSHFFIDAIEEKKTLSTVESLMCHLLGNDITKNHQLIIIGGGITQDIGAFTSNLLLRGLKWAFIPTTLLAMADSCIGSKCSINLGGYKNQLGAFHPPCEIIIDLNFLKTLTERELRSGIGEIIKVHIIAGQKKFNQLTKDFDKLMKDNGILSKYIRDSLEIKKAIIERDEFDRDYRNILNYGHTFGHALESLSKNEIPHGVAVSMGMDIANFISLKRGYLPRGTYNRLSDVIERNIPLEFKGYRFDASLIDHMRRDKKSREGFVKAILCKGLGKVFKTTINFDEELNSDLAGYVR
jgi:3-dehydroquinate synthase